MTRALRALTFVPIAACAMSTFAADFPAGVDTPSADQITLRLLGQTIHAQLPDKSSWRIEYRSDGTYELETSKGFVDAGKWRTEAGKLCNVGKKMKGGCSEVRTQGDSLFLKRDNGDVLKYISEAPGLLGGGNQKK